jgi:predicted phage tail protein
MEVNMNTPVNVFLGGKLGQLFGKKWTLYVNSPAEAIRAIDINVQGKLKEYLSTKGAKKYYKVALQKKDNCITKEELTGRSGQSDIYILPVIKGAGENGGILQIAAAAIIAVVNFFFLGNNPYVYAFAASLALGGVVQLLTPIPKKPNEEDSRQSTTFAGNASSVSQGSAVGLIYGRALVSPMPISLSFNNFPEKLGVQIDEESPERVDLPNGGFYYQ